MFNIEYEYFKGYARIAKEAINNMALVWEQMQFNNTEPNALQFNNNDYPFGISFDDVASRFSYWIDSLE